LTKPIILMRRTIQQPIGLRQQNILSHILQISTLSILLPVNEIVSTKIFVDIYETLRVYSRVPDVEISFERIAMKRAMLPRPTDAELAILRVLWELGPATVRQVQEALSQQRETGYTTVLKFMQIMTEKGLVERDQTERTHVYHVSLTEEQTQRQLVGDLLDRAFGGSARQLVMQALATKKTPEKEMAEIKRLLDKLEGEGQ
jgi:BlaI family transcriptional regulator, penicillinase repressor